MTLNILCISIYLLQNIKKYSNALRRLIKFVLIYMTWNLFPLLCVVPFQNMSFKPRGMTWFIRGPLIWAVCQMKVRSVDKTVRHTKDPLWAVLSSSRTTLNQRVYQNQKTKRLLIKRTARRSQFSIYTRATLPSGTDYLSNIAN